MNKTYLISDICDVGSSKRIYLSEYQNMGVPFYRGKEIIEKEDNKEISNELFISRERYNEIKIKYGVPEIGDILMTAVGTIGISWYVDESDFYFKDGNLIWFKNFKQDIINSKYLYYIFKSKMFSEIIKNISIGSTQKAITIEQIKKIELSIPSINIQNKIVKILDDINKKIVLNNQMNDNLNEVQRCYFKELFNSDLYNEMKLDDLFDISAGGDAPKDKSDHKNDEYIYPIVSNGIDNDGIYGYSKEFKINKKSVTISARGTIGYKVLRNYCYYPIVRLISLVPKSDSISSEYLFYALDEVQILGSGTTQQQLTVPMVKNIIIKVYDYEKIKKFTDFSSKTNMKIESNRIENMKLSLLRDTLLPKLMNGEICLDNIEI